jgi:hypothetical protein
MLTAKRQHHLVGTGVTAEPHKAMGQDAALQVGVKCLSDIIGQTLGGRIGRGGGGKGLQVLGDEGRSETRPGREGCDWGLAVGRWALPHSNFQTTTTAAVAYATDTTHLCTIS